MPNTKYQVNLCVDGKHSVSVQSDDPAAVTEGLLWAKKTWGQLVRLPGKSFPTLTQDGSVPIDQAANPRAPHQVLIRCEEGLWHRFRAALASDGGTAGHGTAVEATTGEEATCSLPVCSGTSPVYTSKA